MNIDALGYGLSTWLGCITTRTQATTHTADQLYDISEERVIYIQVDLPLSSRFNNDRRDVIGAVPIIEVDFFFGGAHY
jgi:hypothetical protein